MNIRSGVTIIGPGRSGMKEVISFLES